MARRGKKNDSEHQLFLESMNNIPQEQREYLESFGISNFNDLIGLATIMGIDMDKMQKFADEHGPDTLPSMEDVMFDEDDPNGVLSHMLRKTLRNMSETEDFDGEFEDLFGEEDPLGFPQKILFEEEPASACYIRIKLNNSPIPIWRELEVPSNISLAFFAFVIIEAMGWRNEHLHRFKHKNTIYQNRAHTASGYAMFGDFANKIRAHSTEDYPISALLKEKGDRIHFEYDLGDEWRHDIWVKGIREYRPDEKIGLKILKGKGVCPPEDCGGVWGYADLLEILAKKRKSAIEKERLQWYGIENNYDPYGFDIEYIGDNLSDLWETAVSSDQE